MTEFAARPVTDRGLVGEPANRHPATGYWSRWEKTTTTFGPVGRVGSTVGILLFLVAGVANTFFMLWVFEVIVGGWLSVEVWKPGWYVPPEGIDEDPASPGDR